MPLRPRPDSYSSTAMSMVTCRMPQVQIDALDRVAEQAGMRRSDVVRQMLADGIRRATAAANHPALLPDDLRPPRETT